LLEGGVRYEDRRFLLLLNTETRFEIRMLHDGEVHGSVMGLAFSEQRSANPSQERRLAMMKREGQRERPQQHKDEFRISICEEGYDDWLVYWARKPFDVEKVEERWLKRWEEGFPEGTVFEHEDFPDNTERSWNRVFVAVLGGKVLERVKVCQTDDCIEETGQEQRNPLSEGEEPTYTVVKCGGYFERARRLAFPEEYADDEPMPELWYEVLVDGMPRRWCRRYKTTLYMSVPTDDEDIAQIPDYDPSPYTYTERPEPLNMDDYLWELVEWYIDERKKEHSKEQREASEDIFSIIPEGIEEPLPF